MSIWSHDAILMIYSNYKLLYLGFRGPVWSVISWGSCFSVVWYLKKNKKNIGTQDTPSVYSFFVPEQDVQILTPVCNDFCTQLCLDSFWGQVSYQCILYNCVQSIWTSVLTWDCTFPTFVTDAYIFQIFFYEKLALFTPFPFHERQHWYQQVSEIIMVFRLDLKLTTVWAFFHVLWELVP